MTRKRDSTAADRVWAALVPYVFDHMQDWRVAVSEATGLPFGRVRALKRLMDGPLPMHALAESMYVDPPAATVVVNDLEARGLVVREPHPTNRRTKLVSLTPAGREVVARAKAAPQEAPAAFAELSPAQLAALAKILDDLATR